MTLPGLELLLRVGLATLLGIAIGVERQWRARMAGLQTMALVSMGAALFLILGAYTFHREQDPTRVAAQIVTGIGFLGAGVIMKQGSSVTGLNTAATLWATAAVGALAGAWAWREAVAGAAMIIAANGFLYPLAARMDRLHFQAGREVTPVDYTLEVVCQRNAESAVRSKLIEAVTAPGVMLTSLARRNADAPNEVVLTADVAAGERQDARLESAVGALGAEPVLSAVRWSPTNEAAADWIGRQVD